MSFGKVANKLYFKTLDTDENAYCGTFSLSESMQLKFARMMIYKHGMTVTNQQFRLAIYASHGAGAPIITSDWFDLADITTLTTYWIGFLRFDFNNEFLEAGYPFFFKFQTQNYTRTGDTDWVGIPLDWPNPINTPTDPEYPPIGIELYGFE